MLQHSRSFIVSCALLLSAVTFHNILPAKASCAAGTYAPGSVYHLQSAGDVEMLMQKSESKSVILDFGAEWCGYCKKAAPKFEELAKKFPHVAFISIDTDEEGGRSVGAKYQVSGLPTFLFIQNGEVKDRAVGFNDDMLTNKVSSFANMVKSNGAPVAKAVPAEAKKAAVAVEKQVAKEEAIDEAELDALIKQVESEMKALENEAKPAAKAPVKAEKAKEAPKKAVKNQAKAAVTELKSYGELEQIVAASEKPVVVRFYAEWCPHCKTNAPIFKGLAAEMPADAVFVQMEESVMKKHAQELEKFDVQAFPTVTVVHKTPANQVKVPNKPATFKADVKKAVAQINGSAK